MLTQTDTSTQTGNCLQTAVASFLGLTLDEVSHFILHPDWERRFTDFMKQHGQPVTLSPYHDTVCGIGIGPSSQYDAHAVVLHNGEMVWDPHPSREGLLHITHVYATQKGAVSND